MQAILHTVQEQHNPTFPVLDSHFYSKVFRLWMGQFKHLTKQYPVAIPSSLTPVLRSPEGTILSSKTVNIERMSSEEKKNDCVR